MTGDVFGALIEIAVLVDLFVMAVPCAHLAALSPATGRVDVSAETLDERRPDDRRPRPAARARRRSPRHPRRAR